MPVPRKGLAAALALISLFLFLRHVTAPSLQPASAGTGTNGKAGSWSPSRSYPPPGSAKKGQNSQQVIHDIASQPLIKQLEFFFPYDMESKFPAYIWQTWKANPAQKSFDTELRPMEASWTEKHPGFVHEVIVDGAADELISYLYASVPAVVQAYKAMPMPILKADFFRYLILLARGGIYSDIDTQAIQSAVDWLPPDFDPATVGLVVGIEADPDREDWNKWYSRRIQFCQWTIQSKAGHPILRDIVAKITETTLEMKDKSELVSGRLPPSRSVVEYTGPAIWTDTIFSYFNNRDYFDYSSRPNNITVKDFFGMTKQKKVGDVVVLPITSFSPGVGQMNAGEPDDPMAFVHHDFGGTWKPESERHIGE